MSFLKSRAEQLAAHLRDGIRRKEWTHPLPNNRDWARQLNVSRTTLSQALALLQKEGLLRIEKQRGVFLVPHPRPHRSNAPRFKAVRIIYYGSDYPESILLALPWIGPLSMQLQQHQIQLRLEKCSDERLHLLCAEKPPHPAEWDELLLPISIPAQYQKLLASSARPTVLLGAPSPDISLPSINCDNVGVIRHATHHLLRSGLRKIVLLLDKTRAPGNDQFRNSFTAAIRKWPHQPIQSEVISVPLDPIGERNTYLRFSNRFHSRQGIILVPPLSVNLLLNTLMTRDIKLPEAAEIIMVMSNPESIRVYPPLTHYPFPVEAFVKTMTHTAVQFFKKGKLPPLHKVLPLEMVAPSST